MMKYAQLNFYEFFGGEFGTEAQIRAQNRKFCILHESFFVSTGNHPLYIQDHE